MSKLTNYKKLYLGIIPLFFSLNFCMEGTLKKKALKKKESTVAPHAIKLGIIDPVTAKNPLKYTRSFSPTLSPPVEPRSGTFQRPASPLSISQSKRVEEVSDDTLEMLAEKGKLVAIKELLMGKSLAEPKDTFGKIMFAAIRGDNFNVVQYFLENYKDRLNLEYKGAEDQTLLIEASKRGSFEIVNYLLCLGAQCNVQSRTGDTPLHEAARFGRIEVIKRLLKEENIKIAKRNRKQQTPLYLAVKKWAF